MWNPVRRLAVVMPTMALLAGCSLIGGDMSDQPTLTEEQAEKRVEAIIQSTAAQLSPKPTLSRIRRPETDRGKCVDPEDGGSEERIQVSRRYWLEKVPPDKNGEIGRQIRALWEGQGHRIIEATGIEVDRPDVLARTRPDDFSMSVQWSTDGSLSLGATSPCIWPDGTPEPS